MPVKFDAQLGQSIYQQLSKPESQQNAASRVMQDKRAIARARTSSRQPARYDKVMRAQPLNNINTRSQNPLNGKSSLILKKVQITGWSDPVVKAELQRIAEQEGLSLSAVVDAGLKVFVRHKLHVQNAALLQPILESVIDRKLDAKINRLAILLVRNAFSSEQTRILSTNILGRQEGVGEKELNEILDRSSKAAKAKITQKTPQLEQLIKEVKQWLTQQEQEEQKPHE